MKKMMKKMVLLVALCLATMVAGYAQEPSKAEIKIKEIVKKYENVKGVTCVTVAKGSGLGIVKMMLNSQVGKDLTKGVTRITIIEYSEASQQTCLALRKELDVFKKLLEEFDVSEKDKYKDCEYVRSFAMPLADEKSVSDFIIAIEDAESKMIMHMAGKMKIE
jgi:hypothetical protein